MNNSKIQALDSARRKRAVIFARVRSLPHDAALDRAHLAHQERLCRQVAYTIGATVQAVYTACGGTTAPVVRQVIEEMLREIERGGVDYVIVRGHDRLARRPGELARIVRRLAATGARLTATADPATAFGEQVALFCLLAAANERRAA